MNENIAIEFDEVSKRFRRGRKLLLKEALLEMFEPESTEWFWALKDISFTIQKGETVGVVGPNGSGKSTLLKLISGFMVADKGEITVNGKVSPLIELGAGFHPELSGRENVFLNGTILGLTTEELEQRYPSIVNFAGLDEFIDTPVKHYSSGMYMRLGFSIAVHTDPEILLIDEILSVGDSAFQKKSFNKMKDFQKKGVSIVFVSHNLSTIRSFCDRVIYLENSRINADGNPSEVTELYKRSQK